MQKLYDYIDEGAFLEDVEAYAEELIQRGEISREQFNKEKEKLYTYFDKKCKETERNVWERTGKEHGWTNSSRKPIKSVYTREDYDRFDEYGEYIPYKPTEEELAKKDEIKTVLKQELSDAYEPDPMDNYAGYDSTNERIDMACERVAKQFGVDTDFVEEIAGEIDRENIARQNAEPEYVYQHCKDKDRFWDWYNGEDISLEELGIDKEQMDKEVDEIVRKYVNSSRQIKSSMGEMQEWNTLSDDEKKRHDEPYNKAADEWIAKQNQLERERKRKSKEVLDYWRKQGLTSRQIKSSYEDAFIVYPWSNNVTGTSDEDLGLSYVVEAYGNEFVNVDDDDTLKEIRDSILVRYFDDDAYVRDWNINNPDNQIESAYDIIDPETELSLEELARYFDYDAYGRELRLESNMVWDSENEYWISSHNLDDDELNNDKYIFMGNN